jgi:phosphoribosyl 1,2-cyclic phosphodiesterase
MNITFWGVRGSIATSGPEFAEVGGNTTCVEIEADGERLIIDAGTGLRPLGDKLITEARLFGRQLEATFLFSHLHWDHIQGFPFFAPAFMPGTSLNLYGPREEGAANPFAASQIEGGVTIEDALRRQMQPPLFPVRLDDMPSKKRFHTLGDGSELSIGGFTVRVRALSHPQGSLGYRIEHGGQTLCFATDNEHPAEGVDEALVELARGVDLFICDAQYTEAEYDGKVGPCRRGWGHSTYVAAARTARAAGVKRLVLTHHDPSHDDATIARIERETQALFAASSAAREAEPLSL